MNNFIDANMNPLGIDLNGITANNKIDLIEEDFREENMIVTSWMNDLGNH